MIRLHQLEGFYHLARLGNYTKAAQAFSYPIGQPAVYQQVKGLQEDLGQVLVRQAGPRRTELTPEGRALFNFLVPFFDGLPKVVERITAAAAEPIILAADQFLAMEALPSALMAARRTNPLLQVRLEERPSKESMDAVLAGQADAALVHLLAQPPGLSWEPLGRISAVLMVPKAHPLAAGAAPSTTEIAKYPLIVYEPHSPGRLLTEQLFRAYGKRLQVAAEVTFSQTMRTFVRAGVGPAFVPYLLPSSKAGARKVVLPSEPDTVSFDMSSKMKGGALPFGLLFRSGMEESITLRVLLKALQAIWA